MMAIFELRSYAVGCDLPTSAPNGAKCLEWAQIMHTQMTKRNCIFHLHRREREKKMFYSIFCERQEGQKLIFGVTSYDDSEAESGDFLMIFWRLKYGQTFATDVSFDDRLSQSFIR